MRREELTLLRSRVNVAVYIVGVVLLILTAGFWHFQIAQTVRYTELADKNRLKQVTIIAKRGRILDREGRILVDNRPSYNIVYVREGARHSLEEIIAHAGPGLGLTPEDIKDRVARSRTEPKFRPIILKEDVDVADIAFVNARKLEFQDEILVEYQPRRRYLEGDLAAHAIGYLGEVTPDELKRNDSKQYKPEIRSANSDLNFVMTPSFAGRMAIDASSSTIGREKSRVSVPKNARSRATICARHWTWTCNAQRKRLWATRSALLLRLIPSTGEILVLASKPAFDPNLFAKKITATAMQELNADPRKPFRNRVIQDRYAPGSVFKIFMAAAGLEAETLNPLDHVNCSGEVSFDGGRVVKHCWKAGGHGPVGLYEAIVNSCNVFFYNVGQKARHRQDRGLRDEDGTRPADRNRSVRRRHGPDSLARMEGACLQDQK